jgi:hypothetical protein
MKLETVSRMLGKRRSVRETQRRLEAASHARRTVDDAWLDELARRHAERAGLSLVSARSIVAAVAITAHGRRATGEDG